MDLHPSRRDLRLSFGVILLVYVAAHLANHALGLISIAAAERGLRVAVAAFLAIYYFCSVHPYMSGRVVVR